MGEDTNLGSFEVSSAILRLYPDDPASFGVYRVTAYAVEETKWGKRASLHLLGSDDVTYQVSSWELAAKSKMTFDYKIIGQKLKLSGFTDKKFLMEVVA